MDSVVVTVKSGFGGLKGDALGDESRYRLEGLVGDFLEEFFGSIRYFPFDLGVVED
jgi:hypothetical protein